MKKAIITTLTSCGLVASSFAQTSLPYSSDFSDLDPGANLTTSNTNFDYTRQSDDAESSMVGFDDGSVRWARITTSGVNSADLSPQYVGFGATGLSVNASGVLEVSYTVNSSFWRVNSGLIFAMGDWGVGENDYSNSSLVDDGNFAFQLKGRSNGATPQSGAMSQYLNSAGDWIDLNSGERDVVNDADTIIRIISNNSLSQISVDGVNIASSDAGVWVDGTFINSFDLLGNADPSSFRVLAHGRGGSSAGPLVVDVTGISVIPEPASFALILGAGLFAMAFCRRR